MYPHLSEFHLNLNSKSPSIHSTLLSSISPLTSAPLPLPNPIHPNPFRPIPIPFPSHPIPPIHPTIEEPYISYTSHAPQYPNLTHQRGLPRQYNKQAPHQPYGNYLYGTDHNIMMLTCHLTNHFPFTQLKLTTVGIFCSLHHFLLRIHLDTSIRRSAEQDRQTKRARTGAREGEKEVGNRYHVLMQTGAQYSMTTNIQ